MHLKADDPITECGTFKTGDSLFQVGRSSGISFGACSGIQPDIKWPEHDSLTKEWNTESNSPILVIPGRGYSMRMAYL